MLTGLVSKGWIRCLEGTPLDRAELADADLVFHYDDAKIVSRVKVCGAFALGG